MTSGPRPASWTCLEPWWTLCSKQTVIFTSAVSDYTPDIRLTDHNLETGISFLNKFWLYDHYNYIIFSPDPSCGPPPGSRLVAATTAGAMVLVFVVTGLGNTATILTIARDTRHTCSRWLML